LKYLQHSHYYILFGLDGVSSKSLMSSLKTANLNATELQDLIDVLLNKQGDNAQWKVWLP